MSLPTRAEFDRARSTPRAYVVVDARGLRWVLRPVLAAPRPEPHSVNVLRLMAGRFASRVIAERMIAEMCGRAVPTCVSL